MSKNNLLTEDVILEAMSDANIAQPGELDTEEAMKIVLNYFGAEIKTDWGGYCDMYYYEETTTDGYSIWVATENDGKVSVSEDVYYYDSDWLESLPEHITSGNTVQLDDWLWDDYAFTDAIEQSYEQYWNEKKEEIENELIEKGYEFED